MEPTRINAHLTLREYRGGIRYGTDALLLASFVRGGRRARCADLGTGCGVIPLLLLVSGRCGEARGFEVQAEYAALAAENARDNGLDGRFAVVQGDIRQHRPALSGRLGGLRHRQPALSARGLRRTQRRFCQIRRVSRAFRRYRRFCPRGCISIGYGAVCFTPFTVPTGSPGC